MGVELNDAQISAVNRLQNGNILCADTGTGKSRTALAYYYIRECCGNLKINGVGRDVKMKSPRDLFIITPAKKRDAFEWEHECIPFAISNDRTLSRNGVKLTVDSWNNIKKYTNVCNAFFIFDEQRLVGSGVWVKSFYQIAKKNHWILLSATPGDVWEDYIPVFVANGFYKNKNDFIKRHVIYDRYTTYPKIKGYINEQRLLRLRDNITIKMEVQKPATVHNEDIIVNYDRKQYRQILKDRWNVFENKPIDNVSQLAYLLRKVSNTSKDRIQAVCDLIKMNPKVIIFYNFDYELAILREISKKLNIPKAEWNGHMHQDIPTTQHWMYLVQYTAGAEAWNCTQTNTIIFYSQNYSYKITKQSAGRVDRYDTPFKDLYIYYIRSMSGIDLAIKRAYDQKKNFNEKKYFMNR